MQAPIIVKPYKSLAKFEILLGSQKYFELEDVSLKFLDLL